MLIYINILQQNLPNYQAIHSPVHKAKIYKTTIYKTNAKYWNTIYQSPNEITNLKILYYIFIEAITKPKVLKTTQENIIHEKYRAYKTMINNIFLTPELKHQLQTIFETTQKHYFALKHFLKIARHKFNPSIYKITTDLSLQPLDSTNINTFIVYDSTISTTAQPPAYLFSIQDLIRIIKTAITNTSNFFEKPLQPKNPYTNIEFTEHTLYAFFYKLYQIRHPIPPILHKYFQSQFNLQLFLINNQAEIRDISIRNFVTTSPSTVLHEEILDMINDSFYDDHQEINIDDEFPRTKLVQIMRPYLYVYLLKDYYIYGSDKRSLAKTIFKRAVNNFIIYNPKFGERIVPTQKQFKFEYEPKQTLKDAKDDQSILKFGSTTKQNPSKNKPMFFDGHPKFSMTDIETYLQDPKKLVVRQPPRQESIWDSEGSDNDIG